MRLRVLVNATILNARHMRGLGVYTLSLFSELLPRLCEAEEIESVTLIGHDRHLTELFGDICRHEKVMVDHVATSNPIMRLLALNHRVARRRTFPNVLYYSPTHHGVMVKGVRQVITIHDLFALIFPGNYRMQNYFFRFYMPRVMSATDVVIADSRNTAQDLSLYYKTAPRTIVAHAAMRTDIETDNPEAVPGLQPEQFFLFVGPNYSYKNADRLIDAFAMFRERHQEYRHRLVFVSGRRSYLQTMKNHIASNCPHLAQDILFLGYMGNNELAWLYQQASAAMVTTLYEGFGLPALEAMHFGCPVIASAVASLPEVCNDAALYVDPYNVADISKAMTNLATDQRLRSHLIEKGRANVKRFSWKATADRVFDTIMSIVD